MVPYKGLIERFQRNVDSRQPYFRNSSEVLLDEVRHGEESLTILPRVRG